MSGNEKVGMRFRDHTAPCGLPCKLLKEALPGEQVHEVTEECPRCIKRAQRIVAHNKGEEKILINGVVYDKNNNPFTAKPPEPKEPKPPPTPPEPKTPWERMVIPPHALKMLKIRAGFLSVVDAANMIERLYPLAQYHSSQKEAQGTSHTKRTKPGKNKKKSQRVDLYSVEDAGVVWTFYMKRNVLMTVHRNDDLNNIGARSGWDVLENSTQ
jgi:hypothetical protein